MPSFIEELPKKILKKTSSFVKKWYQDYQKEKALLEAQRKKQQEITSIKEDISSAVRMLYNEYDIKKGFKHYSVPIYQDKTVEENGEKVMKRVLVGQQYFPEISYRRAERLGNSESEDDYVYGDFYELRFYGVLDQEIKTNLTDRWKELTKSFKKSFTDKGIAFEMIREEEKKLIFALVDKDMAEKIGHARRNNFIS